MNLKKIESVSSELKEIHEEELKNIQLIGPKKPVNENHQKKLAKIYNHVAWQTAVSYDRVCFLIDQNNHLKEEIINFHGSTILKTFIITQGLMRRWKDERGRSDHIYFDKLAREIWFNYDKRRLSAIANLRVSQNIIYVLTKKCELLRIPIDNFEEWGKSIFINYSKYEHDKRVFDSISN